MDAAGSLSLAQEYLRATLADCPTFQSLTSAADATAALLRIHHEGLPAPKDGCEHTKEEMIALRPCAVVYTEERNGFSKTVDSCEGSTAAGRLKLRLYRSCESVSTVVDSPTSEENLAWKNICGQIIDELCQRAAAGKPGHLAFRKITIDYGPYWNGRELAETQGYWQGMELGIDWQGE
jgi:hypothetical protein